jgi:cytochrome P450
MKTLTQSPTDPAFVQDPYPFYARARATGPLVFWSDYDMPVATTHAAVNTLLRDRRFGREPVTPREIPDHPSLQQCRLMIGQRHSVSSSRIPAPHPLEFLA